MNKNTAKTINVALACIAVIILAILGHSAITHDPAHDHEALTTQNQLIRNQNTELKKAIQTLESKEPIIYKIYEPKDSITIFKGEYSYWFVFDKKKGSYGVKLKGQDFDENAAMDKIHTKSRLKTNEGFGIQFFKRITLSEYKKCEARR